LLFRSIESERARARSLSIELVNIVVEYVCREEPFAFTQQQEDLDEEEQEGLVQYNRYSGWMKEREPCGYGDVFDERARARLPIEQQVVYCARYSALRPDFLSCCVCLRARL